MEATADGIVVVGGDGRVTSANRRYFEMWQVPDDPDVRQDGRALLSWTLEHVDDSESIQHDLVELARHPARASNRVIELTDGRVFEWHSSPQVIDGEVVGQVSSYRDITARSRGEVALREQGRLLAESQRIGHIGSWSIDLATDVQIWTPEMYRLLGVSPDRFVPTPRAFLELVHADDRETVANMFGTAREGRDLSPQEFRVTMPDGTIRCLRGRGELQRDGDETPTRVVGTIEDMTQLRQTEVELRQAQKMEAIGQLSGGLAHDFNNILMVISGVCGQMQKDLRDADPFGKSVEAIRGATDRAATLTRRLLAFGRRQMLEPRVLNMNVLLSDLEQMARRLIGEHIELTIACDPELGAVRIDPNALEQVIVNLLLNARDAIQDGGTVTIATKNVELRDVLGGGASGIPAGAYAVVSVKDTGHGMSPETERQMFEPFFTTKSAGQGSGLGLSMVFGTVAQSHGHVRVDSKVGIGTVIDIYLPRVVATPELPVPDAHAVLVESGTETVLLVEDDAEVRALVSGMLSSNGYSVLEADDGEEGLLVAERYVGPIHVLVSDLVMPRMGGADLFRHLVQVRPGVRPVFMSGYSDDVVRRGLGDMSGARVIQKPFANDTLLTAVSEVLAETWPAT